MEPGQQEMQVQHPQYIMQLLPPSIMPMHKTAVVLLVAIRQVTRALLLLPMQGAAP